MRILYAVFFMVAITTSARADVISYTSYGLTGGNVSLSYTGVPQLEEYAGAGPISLFSPTQHLTAYCIDLFHWLLGSGTYTFAAPDTALSAKDINFISDVSNLIAHAGVNPSSTIGEATQIAIWSLEYNGVVDGRVVTGPLIVTPDDPSVMSAVSENYAFLGLNGSVPGVGYRPGLQNITELYAPDNQILVTEKVSDPGPMTFLYAAVFGLFLLYRGGLWFTRRQG